MTVSRLAEEAEASRLINLAFGQENPGRKPGLFNADAAFDVHFWHKADICYCAAYVRFWGRAVNDGARAAD